MLISAESQPAREVAVTCCSPLMHQLTADNLHLWRGEAHVLRGVSFSVNAGECLQITGANGSGKTTSLAARLVWPGRRWRRGASAGAASISARILQAYRRRAGLSRTRQRPEGRSDGQRKICVTRWACAAASRAMKSSPHWRAPAWKRRAVLRCATSRPASGGAWRWPGCCSMDAALWLLDEPGSNLDAAGQSLLAELLGSHTGSGWRKAVGRDSPGARTASERTAQREPAMSGARASFVRPQRCWRHAICGWPCGAPATACCRWASF